jgi:hypothetical protein
MMRNLRLIWSSWLLLITPVFSCNKLVQVPLPINSVTATQTFATDATATSAMLGIYSGMIGSPSFSSFETTFYAGESADEISDEAGGSELQDPFLSNTLSLYNDGGAVSSDFWRPAYFDIYSCNSLIEGVNTSTGLTATTRAELIGESKFIRALCYFYLTNFFGDLPLVLSTDFNQTATLPRVAQSRIYQQIISDLSDAQNYLVGDFSFSAGAPTRANKWAATALLARTYLYQNNWSGADSASTAIINSGLFRLVGLDTVFKVNSSEAIFALETPPNSPPWATLEGNFFIPARPFFSPQRWLTPQLLNAFETGDGRELQWVECNTHACYAYKYQTRIGNPWSPNENYMVLRLAEQYLIRAEANAHLGQTALAINDLNAIRGRAGLDSLNDSLNQTQVLTAVQQENRIEFFAEWGHRWLDLKRWGIALQTLDTISYKSGIDSTQLLYPIPLNEIIDDPNLLQNAGYH